jgi:diaminopimelate epimerase
MAFRQLQKWHGAGNDFLVDVVEHGTTPWWTADRARAVLNRHTGIGADGLLLAHVGSDIEMVLYNADGTQAEMSGNGIRCLVAGVKNVTRASWDEVDVVTAAGVRHVALSLEGTTGWGTVSMGPVTINSPIPGALGVASVGNPHVVVMDDETWTTGNREHIASELAAAVGGANVEFVRVTGVDHLTLQVLERGVGWTQACGTGSCASAAVCRAQGLVGDVVRVDNPGGTLEVDLRGSEALLSGPVQFVGHMEWLEV